MKKPISIFLFFLIFIAIPNIHAQQQPYHHVALEYLKRSLEYMMVGDYHNAIISSNNVIRIDPNSAISYLIRARAYYELNDFYRAIIDSTQAIRLDRNNAAAYVVRGNAHIQNGDYTRAIADWQAALRINPNIEEAAQNIETARQQRDQ